MTTYNTKSLFVIADYFGVIKKRMFAKKEASIYSFLGKEQQCLDLKKKFNNP